MDQTKVSVPNELKELPIMKFIGDQIPQQLKTPEAKKTISKAFFWVIVVGLGYLLIRNLDTVLLTLDGIIAGMAKILLIGGLGIVLSVGYALYPKLVNFLHRVGKVMLFKADKRFIQKNPIENLQVLAQDVDQAIKEVDNKINEADGIRVDFVTDAANLDKEADKKFARVLGLHKEAKAFEEEAGKLEEKGYNEKARQKKRDAEEAVNNAYMLKSEAESDKETAGMYAQYANQFGKAIEILKDNRSAAKMYLNATKTTIRIIERKLDATTRMKNASEGIAAAFNIKDSWVFQVAMQSAQATISQNVATIRNNLQLLNQNRALLQGTKNANRAELDDFVKQMEEGKIRKLNVAEISDPGYELESKDIVDKGFNIL